MQIAKRPALYSISRSDVKLRVTYWTIEQHKKTRKLWQIRDNKVRNDPIATANNKVEIIYCIMDLEFS